LIRFRRHGVAGNRIVRIDHPQAMPATCDLLVLPGAHHAPKTMARLQYDFGHDLLAGWEYVMLDEEVTHQPPIPFAERMQGPIVFCAGGSDPSMAFEQMACWCTALPTTMPLLFMIPQQRLNVSSIPLWSKWVPFSRDLLRHAAMVVGFLGQITYECLWYQTPMLCFARQDLDREPVAQLARDTQGAVTSGGCFQECTASLFCDWVEGLWKTVHGPSPPLAPARDLLDGLGLHRVAEAILTLMAGK
jgi:spore coat polysaccharide biosynthesis predicted glycosyltransferase SpsG